MIRGVWVSEGSQNFSQGSGVSDHQSIVQSWWRQGNRCRAKNFPLRLVGLMPWSFTSEHPEERSLPKRHLLLQFCFLSKLWGALGCWKLYWLRIHVSHGCAKNSWSLQFNLPYRLCQNASYGILPRASRCLGSHWSTVVYWDWRSLQWSVTCRFKRQHHILDSLASICVRKGKGEVYAIAL
jgi:hypothetical protein